MGPPPTIGPPPTPDLRPTKVSPWLIKIPGGGYLAQDIGYPSKMPRYLDAWTLDFPKERKSVTVRAGGYLYTPETYDQELLKPEQGAIAVGVVEFRPGMPDRRLDDPRNGGLILPVRDGMARIVDALVTGDRIMVMIRTDGSAYTYEVNTHTLAVAQPPTVEPGGPYRVRAGELLNLEAQGRDIAGTQFDYAWDLDGDGVFEVRSQRVTFSARDLTTSQGRTVAVRVTARNGLSATAQVPIAVAAP